MTNDRRVRPSSQQQRQALHEQRLAGAGLTGDCGEPGTEQDRDVVDDPQVADVQLRQHGHRSGSWNLAFKIWWKSLGSKVTTRAGFGAPVHRTESPASSWPSS